MKNAGKLLKNLWNDESGQGATEYILLLVVVVGLAVMFKGRITQMVQEKLSELGSQMAAFSSNSN